MVSGIRGFRIRDLDFEILEFVIFEECAVVFNKLFFESHLERGECLWWEGRADVDDQPCLGVDLCHLVRV
jgi:hypothetical protein